MWLGVPLFAITQRAFNKDRKAKCRTAVATAVAAQSAIAGPLPGIRIVWLATTLTRAMRREICERLSRRRSTRSRS
jgi:hypothetical protein